VLDMVSTYKDTISDFQYANFIVYNFFGVTTCACVYVRCIGLKTEKNVVFDVSL
jgi:hypothetical protein